MSASSKMSGNGKLFTISLINMCDVMKSDQNSLPSPWIVKWAPHIRSKGLILDLAAGSGRHTHYVNKAGHAVIAVDKDVASLQRQSWAQSVNIIKIDLEDETPWPFASGTFAGIIVTNYLHRPLLPDLARSLEPGGLLLYETFAIGHEKFGKPSNPDFLLQAGELLSFSDEAGLTTLGYFSGEVTQPRPAVIQCLAARA